MDRSEIEKDMLMIVCEALSLPPTCVNISSNFREDLGADSLDELEIVMSVEEYFGTEIDDEDAENCKTVKDSIDLVEGLMGTDAQ